MGFLKRHACPECGRRFGSGAELMGHEQTVHSGGSYDCKECGTNYSSMEEMRSHLKKEHGYR